MVARRHHVPLTRIDVDVVRVGTELHQLSRRSAPVPPLHDGTRWGVLGAVARHEKHAAAIRRPPRGPNAAVAAGETGECARGNVIYPDVPRESPGAHL